MPRCTIVLTQRPRPRPDRAALTGRWRAATARRMPIRYPDVLSHVTGPLSFEWTDKETLLYAIAIGFGDDERDLPYVYEQPGLKVLPTLTTVLANGTLPDFGEIGINE